MLKAQNLFCFFQHTQTSIDSTAFHRAENSLRDIIDFVKPWQPFSEVTPLLYLRKCFKHFSQ